MRRQSDHSGEYQCSLFISITRSLESFCLESLIETRFSARIEIGPRDSSGYVMRVRMQTNGEGREWTYNSAIEWRRRERVGGHMIRHACVHVVVRVRAAPGNPVFTW